MARNTYTPQERAEHRNAILRAAKSCFCETGYNNTTMRQVAQAADMSLGSLYYYFKSKDEIYIALYDTALDFLNDAMEAALTTSVPNIQSRITVLCFDYFEFSKNHNDYFQILTQGNKGDIGDVVIPEEVSSKGNKIIQKISKVIAQGVEEGVVKPCDTYKTTVAMWAMIDGLLMLHENTRTELLGDNFIEYYALCVNLMLDGLVDGTITKEYQE